MSSVFRRLTLNRIGAGLFVVGFVLLVVGAAGVVISAAVISAASSSSSAIWGDGLSAGQAVLLGLACLFSSAVVFAHAITHERLARVEAKLDALVQERGAERRG
jgi:hypothetical protein